nr:Rne/Rng family ribonuclease [Corynebacterium provencense]
MTERSGVPDGLPVLTEGSEFIDEPVKLKGSTRLESKRRWRQEQGHEKNKIVTRAEFLARRENVDRAMVVRDSERSDHPGTTTQVGITEDGILVEHVVTSETQSSIIGNIYLGRVQNVLSSMEAAFIDIGTGRNAVLYAGEVDWRSSHLHARTRRIEAALRAGDQILVQVIKDPLGHKGARLTNRLSFAGRYLVYIPGGRTHGISRKLPEAERKRLKGILNRVVPDDGGTIIRTAAEGVSEELIAEDVHRLHQRWLDICEAEEKARGRKGSHPVTMYEEPNMLVKVIRDIFNEDFNELVVDGEKSWEIVRDYVHRMAPDLESRLVRYRPEDHGGRDVFEDRQLDEQLAKALSRKVWLPSGGYLIIDRTEAMTVIDVNTGSFVGSGGNLEETVTLTNLEAAEEIVRQMRLRDMGGMIVVDFIDMVLPENRDLMLRRLTEYLGRDRTRHKVSEVTSLGLVQMTRKRLGTGLLETFSTECPTCGGRGVIIHADPVEHNPEDEDNHGDRRDHGHRSEKRQARELQEVRRRHEKDRAQQADVRDTVDSGDSGDTAESTDGDRSGGHGREKHPQEKHRQDRSERRQSHPEKKSGGHRKAENNRSGDAGTTSGARDHSDRDRDRDRARERSADSGRDAVTDGAPVRDDSPRRGRRRVVRRVIRGDRDIRDSAAVRDSGDVRDGRGGSSDRRRTDRSGQDDRPHRRGSGASARSDQSVAEIAAQAVARAGAEDPDEPSGADYVSDQVTGKVTGKVTDAHGTEDGGQHHGGEVRLGTDRRGRRRVRRVVRPAAGRNVTQTATRSPLERVAAVTEPQTEPQITAAPAAEGTSAGGTRTYEEARAEYESSPRRRRRTRGRSRSDVPPVESDFVGGSAAPAGPADTVTENTGAGTSSTATATSTASSAVPPADVDKRHGPGRNPPPIGAAAGGGTGWRGGRSGEGRVRTGRR